MSYCSEQNIPNNFKVDQNDCQFQQQNDLSSLDSSYVYITDDNIHDFINQIDNYFHVSSIMICQNFFYQKIDSWCDFQDKIASLFTHLPLFQNLNNLYIKLDIYSSNSSESFRKINISSINSQNKVISNSTEQNNYNQLQNEHNNVIDMLSDIINVFPNLKNTLNVHLIMHIGQGLNTKHFIDSISKITILRSLEIKYYYDQTIEEALNIQYNENNNQIYRNLFLNLTRQISQCKQLKNLKLIIPNANQITNISANDQQGDAKESFSQQVMQLTHAISYCKKLSNVSLQVPIQFFFLDYLKQKNISEQTIYQNFQSLCQNKSINVFQLHLIKFKNTPNMRRRTQQINNLVQYLKKGILLNLPHLVHYLS